MLEKFASPAIQTTQSGLFSIIPCRASQRFSKYVISAFGGRYKEHTIRGGPEPRWILQATTSIRDVFCNST